MEFRFYAELGDFLPPGRRGRAFEHAVAPHENAKHAIEALGVPHTEVALLLVNGRPAPLESFLQPGDRVAVLPALRRLAPEVPAGGRRFIADAHLGRLARYLRFAGLDTLWHNAWDDAELVALAADEDRIVLTRDRALLMHRHVHAGGWLRDDDPLAQLADVARRWSLPLHEPGPSRCLECNAVPVPVPKAEVAERLLPNTRASFEQFWRCPGCQRIFWRGSHWRRMHEAVRGVAATLASLRPVSVR
ncbi:Mut7-C RNAse domain-containing protein [Azohydromonas caseinilytica]|uniref:Mut7-C ubiquitin/RNAse domain-containing protein n=1 Tax=Azohydromonas caseinilytica TaxID=2728836 RepID=A0A848FAK1_9BURK|nr:Mut7-C RNAse domain-containing protein [Azohydromonas caseinilytica]NML15896.1 Mut7-C ubiquitin/RNAse domain-containing protein [Azohydromonas caseinilytica]